MSGSHVVAVVEDDLAVLGSMKFLLETAGYSVAAYNSAAAFLDDRLVRPACLIVDQHMPVMTGLELVARLCPEAAAVPAVLVTGSLSAAIAVLEKPPAEHDLLRFIDAHF